MLSLYYLVQKLLTVRLDIITNRKGEAAVGKSSLVMRFVNNEFHENKEPTIGAAFLTQKCRIDDKVVKFEIWDTAGQERFHSLAPMYYRNAQAAIVVYDVTNPNSLVKARSWILELQKQGNTNMIIALAGNKIDRKTGEDNGNIASKAEGQQLAEEFELLFFETSAKENQNVKEMFNEIASRIISDGIVNNSLLFEPQTVQIRDQSIQKSNCYC